MTTDKPPQSTAKAPPAAPVSPCLVEVVAETMRNEPTLEAVKFDRANHSISVATLGRTNRAELESTLTENIAQAHERSQGQCSLMEGEGDCTGCAQAGTAARASELGLTLQHGPRVTTIARATCPTAPTFWRWHHIPWPKFTTRTMQLPEDDEHEHEWKQQLVAASLCGLWGLIAAWGAGEPYDKLFFALSYVAGSWYTIKEVWERLVDRVLDVHFLMLAVAAGSAVIGAYAEGATLLFLFSFSGALEHYALGRTHREIKSLFKSAPKIATQIDEAGRESEIPVESLRPNMRLLVKPDEQFPVDAEVVKGESASDESNLTGEATPVAKALGDQVLAGTLNLWGRVEVKVVRPANQSALQKIIQLIRDAQHRKAPSQRFTDKFGTGYTYLILGLTLTMFFVWWLAFGLPPFVGTSEGPSAFYRAMTLMVVASPCALVLSIPSAVLAAIAWAAKRGILFRGGAAVEKLGEINVVAMDKTGTLTTGELRVEQVESFPPGREEEVATLAFSLERLSHHPLARAITRYGKQQGLQGIDMDQFESVSGRGLKAISDGQPVFLGRRTWLDEGAAAERMRDVPMVDAGFSEVWIVHDDLVGRILLRDDIREQSAGVVDELKAEGLQTIVLTGDRRASAEHLQSKLHLDDVRAELHPEQKVAVIESLVREGRKPAMIGDGVNDAPSLAVAHVGVAMGARGSDAALEQAEVVLMHDRLENFLTAYRLSQRARRVIRQNLFVSLGTVVVLVGFALTGGIPLTIGVLGHEGSTVVVVLNSLRLLLGSGFKKSA